MKHSPAPIDVFISYKREDRETAKALAEALAHRGYSIWWDVDLLPGERFADAIMAVIKRAETTIVLWSEASVASSFVRAEASVADALERLIPARLDACELPLPFNVLHTQDLTGWRAGADETLLAPLFKAIEARTGKAPTAPQQPAAAADNLHRQDDEAELWREVSDKDEPEELAYFVKKYPDGTFGDLAHMRLAKLQKPNPFTATKNAIIALGSVAAAIAAIIGVIGPLADYLPSVEPGEPEVVEQRPPVIEREVEPAAGTVVADRSHQPGDRFNDCDDEGWCPEMVVVPAGSFMMGSPENEEGRHPDEGPQHRITIAEPFAIGVYEMTFDEWDACVADGVCAGRRPIDNGWGRGRRPLIDVSWNDAQAYVRWLSKRTGAAYRLPSEAEWEYAARAGTTTPFHFGPTVSTDEVNYNGNYIYGSGVQGEFRERTVPVGSFPANGFGLHDVHGNVWEWVTDCGKDSYAAADRSGDGMARSKGTCDRWVLRGGSWVDDPSTVRSANRYFQPDRGYTDVGFRVAMTLR